MKSFIDYIKESSKEIDAAVNTATGPLSKRRTLLVHYGISTDSEEEAAAKLSEIEGEQEDKS